MTIWRAESATHSYTEEMEKECFKETRTFVQYKMDQIFIIAPVLVHSLDGMKS